MTHIPERITIQQANRLEELRKRGFQNLTDQEIREFHRIADIQLEYLRFRRGFNSSTERKHA